MRLFPLFPLFLLLLLTPLHAQEEEKKPVPVEIDPSFRKFTAQTGKTLMAKVIARLDDQNYTFETPDGKSYKMALDSFSKSDQQYLEFWQPEFATDLSTLKAAEALPKMGYAAIPMTENSVGLLIPVRVGEATLKLLFDPKARNTILAVESADMAKLTIRDSSVAFKDAAGNQTRSKEAVDAPFTFGDGNPVEATVLVIDLALIGGDKIQKEADGILGTDLLPKLNALVDFAGKTLWVKP